MKAYREVPSTCRRVTLTTPCHPPRRAAFLSFKTSFECRLPHSLYLQTVLQPIRFTTECCRLTRGCGLHRHDRRTASKGSTRESLRRGLHRCTVGSCCHLPGCQPFTTTLDHHCLDCPCFHVAHAGFLQRTQTSPLACLTRSLCRTTTTHITLPTQTCGHHIAMHLLRMTC